MSAENMTRVRRSASRSRQRMLIPDVLRGVAILAMLIAHAGPFVPDLPKVVLFVQGAINDVASPLFALVMGISAQLVWNRRVGVARTLLQQSWRGVILFALGIWMATWGSWVAIVLQPLGLLLILGVPLLLLGTRTLIVVAAAIALLSQPLLTLARGATWVYTQPFIAQELANGLALGRSYRLINLLPFFLLGALLLRHGFRRDRVLWTMAAVAPVAFLGASVGEKLFTVKTQSGDYLDTLHDVGLVFAVYVVVVLMTTARNSAIAKVLEPIGTWGQVALTLYVLHVGLIAIWARLNGFPDENVPLGWIVIVPGMALLGWAWARFVGTGPVEWVLGLITGRPKRWRRH